jgi:D-alanyl-D-alanine carboxypeptidase
MAILVAVVAASCTSDSRTPTPIPAATGTSPEPTGPTRDAQLQALIDEWSATNDPVGVAAAVLYPGGDLWLGAAGLANRELGVRIDPTDRFEIASVTKMFMSTLTLRLAENGAVDLDAPIASLLPDFPAADVITIRMLLGHRAGVYDPSAELVTDRFGPPDPERIFTPDELLDAAANGTPTFPPGSRHDYSNANYWVLAACLQEATGDDIAALLDEYLIGPLGLTSTLLFDDTLPPVEVVNAYKDLDLNGTEDPMGTRPLPGLITPAWTAGGMISSAKDLVHFLDGLFGGGVISDASLAAMLDTSSGGGSYALGIYRSGSLWGHDGGIAGYLSAAFRDVNTGVSVAVLTNRFGPDAPQADQLAPRLASLANEFSTGD